MPRRKTPHHAARRLVRAAVSRWRSLQRRGAPASAAALVLARNHPLLRVVRRQLVVRRHAAAVGSLLAGSALVSSTGAPLARSLALAAGIVFAVLMALALALRHATRQEAARLIAAGNEHLPLAVVQRERRRLLKASTRERLASRFEYYVSSAAKPSRLPLPASRPFVDLLEARAVSGELLQIAALVRREEDRACGVARAEQLLSQGFLITYGGNVAVLRDELHAVIDFLA
jgi:hypothetical protein